MKRKLRDVRGWSPMSALRSALRQMGIDARRLHRFRRNPNLVRLTLRDGCRVYLWVTCRKNALRHAYDLDVELPSALDDAGGGT